MSAGDTSAKATRFNARNMTSWTQVGCSEIGLVLSPTSRLGATVSSHQGSRIRVYAKIEYAIGADIYKNRIGYAYHTLTIRDSNITQQSTIDIP